MIGEATSIGQYRIAKKIGEGGMGSVYLAHHALIGRAAAIKVLLPSLSSQREIVERFFNEARATTTVSDPGIVQVFDFGFHTDGSAYIVMELLEGESLDARIHRGPLAVVDALKITRQVASSLAAAHARGIVHRDLKPENLMLVHDAEAQGGERPKILDFGIAKLTGDAHDRSRTRTGTLLGTPIYMSPEQCRGSGLVDHRSDIYSLGCVLYHMICGRPPFDLEGMGEIISAHLREIPAAPSTFAGVMIAVDELVLRCLDKDPDRRYQSMLDLKAACEALLARITGAGALTIALPQPATVIARPTTLGASAGEAIAIAPRRRGAWLAAAAVVIAALATIGVVVTRGGDPAPVATPAPAATPTTDAAIARPDAAPDAPADAAIAIDAAITLPRPRPHHVDHVDHTARPTPNPGDVYDSR